MVMPLTRSSGVHATIVHRSAMLRIVRGLEPLDLVHALINPKGAPSTMANLRKQLPSPLWQLPSLYQSPLNHYQASLATPKPLPNTLWQLPSHLCQLPSNYQAPYSPNHKVTKPTLAHYQATTKQLPSEHHAPFAHYQANIKPP